MSAKMSPGPWNQAGLATKDLHWMREVRDANGLTVAWCGSMPEATAHANARFIAATLLMRDALAGCLDHMEWSTPQGKEAHRKGLAALRAAEG